MFAGLYRDLVKDAQELENYERSTSLDDPDAIQTLIEEVGGYINNVSSKRSHRPALHGAVLEEDSKVYSKSRKMNIRNDFQRLYQVYLDSNANL